MKKLLIISFVLSGLWSCKKSDPTVQGQVPRHVLVGGWLADDGTIFHFRNDGTFYGSDWRKKEIWGNWVRLSDDRIGFQSLRHKSHYEPQYAKIRKGSSKMTMDYIVSDDNWYIEAKRIGADEAELRIRALVGNGLPVPDVQE